MSTPLAPTLPDGWEDLLDDIARRLEQAVAVMSLPPDVPAEAAASTRSQEMAALAEKVRGLEERSAAAAAQVGAIDEALQAEEASLHARLAAYESARHRLAAWVYRAIG